MKHAKYSKLSLYYKALKLERQGFAKMLADLQIPLLRRVHLQRLRLRNRVRCHNGSCKNRLRLQQRNVNRNAMNPFVTKSLWKLQSLYVTLILMFELSFILINFSTIYDTLLALFLVLDVNFLAELGKLYKLGRITSLTSVKLDCVL